MSSVAPHLTASVERATPGGKRLTVSAAPVFIQSWWPLLLGVGGLLLATSSRFYYGLWQQPEFEHGPLMLAVAVWLLWRQRGAFIAAAAPASSRIALVLIGAGLAAYLFGVRLKAGYVEAGSLVPVLAGALWMIGGRNLVRQCAFALIFVALATPLPSPWVFAATSGLKEWVSQAAEYLLHIAGYPVARDGVTLRVGSYNLLLADACSGMNSLISLCAVGLLYVHLSAKRSAAHMTLLLAAIPLIAVVTNLVRVLILTLITFHLGDEAGQGYLHQFAGFVMFMIALAGTGLVDIVLAKLFPAGRTALTQRQSYVAH